MNTTEVTTTITTTETPFTHTARHAAFQSVANFSDRQLAHFHWEKAERLISDMEHVIRDYSDDEETADFYTHELETIEAAIPKLFGHLNHILAIAKESGARTVAQIKAERAAQKEWLSQPNPPASPAVPVLTHNV